MASRNAASITLPGGAHQGAAHAVHFVVQTPRRIGQGVGRTRRDDVLGEGAEQRRGQGLAGVPARQRGQRARQCARHLGLAQRQ
jgi:hypothetical protein